MDMGKFLIALAISLIVLLGVFHVAKAHETNPMGLTNEQRYDMTLRTVVRISMTSGGGGSGVVIGSDENGTLILSVNHVTRNEDSLWVQIGDVIHDATLVRSNLMLDLSLLHIKVKSVKHIAHIHDKLPKLAVYDEIIIVGSGLRQIPYPSMGIISLVSDIDREMMLDVAVVSGMSGGAVWRGHNDHYELVGIVRAQGTQAVLHGLQVLPHPFNGMTFAISMAVVRGFLDG